jgi:DNA-binding beta-propeller fold protein YncE
MNINNLISRKMMAILIVYSLSLLSWSCKPGQGTKVESKSQLPEAKVLSTLKVTKINPVGIVMFEGLLVVVDSAGSTINKYDIKKAKLKEAVQLAVKSPRGLATNGRTLWIADNTSKKVHQIDPGTGAILKSFEVPIDADKEHTFIEAIACDDSFLWVALSAGWSSKILKIDAETGQLIISVFAECLPRGLAIDGKTLYILAYNKGVFKGNVNKMTISDNVKEISLSNTLICQTPGYEPSGIAIDGNDLWISDKRSKSIQKISLP